jgi:hypothetical protein
MNLRTIDNTMTKRKRTKGQPMTYKTLHIDRLSSMYPTINPEMKSVVIGTDCTGSCKSNYHTIMTTTASILIHR